MGKEIKKYIKVLKDGTKQMFKEFFKKETNKKQRANMWTFIRLLIPLITLALSIGAILTGLMPLFLTSGLLAGFGAVTDYFDGKSSRKHNSTSEYGKLLDQVSDKFFAGIIGINLLFINPAYIAVLLGEGIIACVNVYNVIKYKGIKANSSKLGKIKEWPLFLTLAFGYLSPISATLALIANLTILITFSVQLLTACDYIKMYEKNKLKMKKNSDSKLSDFKDTNQEILTALDKNKTIENNNINSKDKVDRKKQLENLRNVLLEIKKLKQSALVDEETKDYQKIKN